MKKVIRKLRWNKLPKEYFEHSQKHYLVVYRYNYEVLNEYQLKELLLHPTKDDDIKYIFNYEDRLVIDTQFEEVKDENK